MVCEANKGHQTDNAAGKDMIDATHALIDKTRNHDGFRSEKGRPQRDQDMPSRRLSWLEHP